MHILKVLLGVLLPITARGLLRRRPALQPVPGLAGPRGDEAVIDTESLSLDGRKMGTVRPGVRRLERRELRAEAVMAATCRLRIVRNWLQSTGPGSGGLLTNALRYSQAREAPPLPRAFSAWRSWLS